MPNDGELTLLVDGRRLSGWQEVRLTRGAERIPGDFTLRLTEQFPGEQPFVARAGSPCQVLIGGDLVLTGYVDRYVPDVTPTSRQVSVLGRGRCQDLVDCSAYLRGEAGQVMLSTARGLIERLCKVYGIEVRALAGDGPAIPQFNIILTERAWDIIERVARYAAMLAYEGPDGNLVLARAGQDRMASGFREGINVERAIGTFSVDQRYSLYEVLLQSVELLGDISRAVDGGDAWNQRASVADVTVGADRPGTGKRFRPLILVSDQVQPGLDIAEQRALWERNRRNGRGMAVTITTDSWRDASGRLWEPNARVPVHVPSVHVSDAEWVIAEVTYQRGADGTHAELVLMPPDAFEPEPIVLAPAHWDIFNALQRSATTSEGGLAP